MSVRAKFRCDSITDTGDTKTIMMSAVSSNIGENADFTKYTPSGDLSMVLWPGSKAYDFFKPGNNYYLDFTEVTE